MKKKLLQFNIFIFSLICISLNAQKGLHFDGTDDMVQTSYTGVLGTNSRTFEAWIYLNAAPTSNVAILDYGTPAVGSRNTFLVNSSGNLAFISGGSNANLSSNTNTISVGQWTHVAFVLDNGTGYLYINGTQILTGNLTTVDTPSGGENLIIGQRVSGGNIPFAGIIDEVRIWNVARSQTEIQNDMNAEICDARTNNLVAYYKLNDGIVNGNNTSIINVEDSSINSNNGVLNNFTLTGTTSNFVIGASITSSLDDSVFLINNDTSLSAGEAGASYQWLDCANGNTILAGETNQDFTPTTSGSYAVEITANGCTVVSDCIDFMLACSVNVVTNYPFEETFEDDSSTLSCWTQIQEVGNSDWTVMEGASSGIVTTAKNGVKNISFVSMGGVNDPITKYVSPVFDMSSIGNPELSFYYAQEDYQGDINTLKVYYRISDQDAWIELAHLNQPQNTWAQETILLPNPSTTYQIAFEGINNFGHPNVIDDIKIEDKLSTKANSLIEVILYPNPASSTIYLETSNSIEEVAVYTLNGRRLNLPHSNNMIDIGTLSSGVYFVKARINSGVKIFKVIKE